MNKNLHEIAEKSDDHKELLQLVHSASIRQKLVDVTIGVAGAVSALLWSIDTSESVDSASHTFFAGTVLYGLIRTAWHLVLSMNSDNMYDEHPHRLKNVLQDIHDRLEDTGLKQTTHKIIEFYFPPKS